MSGLNDDPRYFCATPEARGLYAQLWAQRAMVEQSMALGREAPYVAGCVLRTSIEHARSILTILRAENLVGPGFEFLAGVKIRRPKTTDVLTIAPSSVVVDSSDVLTALQSFAGSRRKLAESVGCAESTLRSFSCSKGFLPESVLRKLAVYLGCADRVRRDCAETAQNGCAVGAQDDLSAQRFPLSHSPSSLSLSESSLTSEVLKNKEEIEKSSNLKGGGVGEENFSAQTGCAEILRSAQDNNSAQSTQLVSAHPNIRVDVAKVFRHWSEVFGKRATAKLDPKRRGCIERAIKSHGLDTVIAAIDGCSRTPWNTGDNPSGRRYDDLTLILRDATHIEGFAQAPQGTAQTGRSGQASAKMDYQGRKVVGVAAMPTASDWAEDVDFDAELDRRRALYATQGPAK